MRRDWITALALLAPLGLRAEEPPTLVRSIGRTGSGPGFFEAPAGVALDAAGNLYIAELFGYRVQKLGPRDSTIALIGGPGNGPGQLIQPADVVIDQRQRLWVTDRGNHRLQWFTLDGGFLGAFGDTARVEFFNPNGLGLDPNAPYLYVADTSHHRIRKFDISGDMPVPVANFGQRGSGPGDLDQPLDVAISRNGEIHISEWGNNRLQILSPEGIFRMSFGRTGNQPGQFSAPAGVSVDSLDNIYVSDTFNGRVQKFRRNGTFIVLWGPSTDKLYRLRNPLRMALTPDGLAVVCDRDPNRHSDRVAIYRLDGAITAVEARSWTAVRRLYRGR